jgi:meso-butanediol dehydrogenase/(S,S)-butanediol dehydrogenase/diacetyl reductase
MTKKTIVVTGGGQGIGRGISLEFAKHGANVVVCDINIKTAKNVSLGINQMGKQSIALKVDVTSEEDARIMVDETVKKFGNLDVLCNNAGVISMNYVEKLSVKEWENVFAVNVKGVFICSKAVIAQMKKQGYGRIINNASQSGRTGSPLLAHYCASRQQ